LNLRAPAGEDRQLDVAAKNIQTKRIADLTGADGGANVWDIIRQSENEERVMRARYEKLGDDLMILKIPEFFFSDSEISDMMSKARKHKALILDLRGDPGRKRRDPKVAPRVLI
jgi:hypothetical protein